jgi:hypothetical protein
MRPARSARALEFVALRSSGHGRLPHQRRRPAPRDRGRAGAAGSHQLQASGRSDARDRIADGAAASETPPADCWSSSRLASVLKVMRTTASSAEAGVAGRVSGGAESALTDETRARSVPIVPDGYVKLGEGARQPGLARQTVLNHVRAGSRHAVQVTEGKRRGLPSGSTQQNKNCSAGTAPTMKSSPPQSPTSHLRTW